MTPPVHGIGVDDRARCAHYRTTKDVVAVRFPCCGRYYACHACHGALEEHPARRWPPDAFGRRAVLCGACGGELTIRAYLASHEACPRCGAPFNPGCAAHHPLYFRVGGGRGAAAGGERESG